MMIDFQATDSDTLEQNESPSYIDLELELEVESGQVYTHPSTNGFVVVTKTHEDRVYFAGFDEDADGNPKFDCRFNGMTEVYTFVEKFGLPSISDIQNMDKVLYDALMSQCGPEVENLTLGICAK